MMGDFQTRLGLLVQLGNHVGVEGLNVHPEGTVQRFVEASEVND